MRALVHPSVVFGLPIVWLFAVYTLASYMTTRKAVNVREYMKVYNVAQIVLCSYMVWGMMSCVMHNFFGINSAYDATGEWFVFVHYLSKYMDWFDTFWIVLKKNRQQLSFLHVYHHATISMVWGYLLYAGVGNGTARYGAWINSLTHVIMYSHYLWTSFGLKNPFKRYITGWQICQFYSCLAHAFLVRCLETSPSAEYAWLQILYQSTMVYLFTLKMNYVPTCTPDMSAKTDADVAPLQDQRRYIVIRGEVYDVTDFQHPGGNHMMDLGINRDATIMFESAHIRMDKPEKMLKALPKGPKVEELEKAGQKWDQPAENWATPGQSKLYQAIVKRIRNEILKPDGRMDEPLGARGVPYHHIAAVIGTWLASATAFVLHPHPVTGSILGLAMCWIGLAIQHTANHGGLLLNTRAGYLLGLLNDVGPGGSSLVWRYHHQVSHHAYCNDVVLDQDVHSSFPLMRLEKSQKLESWHQWQWLYGPVLFTQLWASIHLQDFMCLLDARTFLVNMRGTSANEIVLGLCLKFVHFSWFYFLPLFMHGWRAMLLPWASALFVGSFWLSALFIVSHNLEATKTAEAPLAGKGDWAQYQIETSASWGGAIGSFFTGGLNLQIEHHLFPCMAHHLYPRVQTIVKEECAKAKVMYTAYDYFFPNFVDHIKFLYAFGRPSKAAKSD
jgi:fatty acid desaturase (delta-4 desaturase)